jgi:S-DNA-T family DNA segregation ATPase FtsK/SpoIIIE
VAGTTGSGKSELLQTLIAGLAVVNRPDEMTFVLIDYKGGAAFKDCAGLPHTVGMVTDLDGHLTQRALASLAAELRRREELLLQAGAKDIEDYLELRDRSPGVLEALPRLLIVIDEFAALASELPDFVAGLVDIGRRGRSLGVHLLLATQRPAGVVTAEIRANTNLRIALRVTDTDESTDVLETPDAARISKATPGRCFVRSGTATPQAVQSARIGGRRPGIAGSGPSSAAVQFLTWTSLGRPLAEPVASLSSSVQTPHPSSPQATHPSSLQTTHPSSLQTTHPSSSQAPHPSSSQATRRDGANGAAEAGGGNPGAGWNVAGRRRAEGAWGAEGSWGTEAASEAGPGVGTGLGAGVGTGLGAGVGTGLGAGEEGLVTDLAVLVRAVREAAGRAGIPSVPSPWLDPLPDELVLSPRQAAGGSVTEVPPIVFGVTDLPEAQSRGPLSLDLATSGHIYVAGAARSGRSTALRSLAGALAASCSPYDVHLYAIDCGANALLPLVALPHCGAVVGRDQLDRTERLITALATEVSRRQQLLAEAGFASLAEQRRSAPSAERLPWMVLLLDRWEGFVGAFEHYDYGRLVTAILQLLREGAAVGLRAVFAGDRSGLGGQVSTVFDRRLVLRMADPADYGYAGFNERQVPADMPPGRVLELRTVGKGGGPLRESQIGLLSDDTSGTGQVATVHALAKLCQDRYGRLPRALRPMHVDELPVRVGYDEALALEPDFLPPSSLWALVGVGRDDLSPVGIDLMADGPGFVIGGPARSGRSTALRTIAHSLLDPAIAGGLVPVVVIAPRRSPLRLLAGRPGVLGVLDATATADDLEDLLEHEHRYVILVDDAELLDETELDDALAKQLRSARDGEHAVVIAGTTQDIGRGYRGFLSDTRRSRSGLLLDIDSPDDGDLLGLRLPRNANYGGPTGRALFVASGVQTQIQVALPPSATDDYR